MELLSTLEWLRPQWLWALALPPVAAALWWRGQRAGSAWATRVDAHLLPHLLERNVARRGAWGLVVAMLAAAMGILALAGPSLGTTTQPVWQTRTPLVIVLDLSSATLAADVPPSRLAVARAKIAQLLDARAGAQVALVAYAGEAFTIAPLTDDAANVALYLDALHPDVMPVDGRDTAAALGHAGDLLARGAFGSGRVLLLSDSADAPAIAAATRLRAAGYRVDVLGLGSAQGAPYRGPRGIDTARLDGATLRALAQAGGGRFAAVTLEPGDLRSLGVLDATRMEGATTSGQGTQRRDDGYWLLPPLMLLAVWAFRRRAAMAMLAACIALPAVDARAQAWQRDDQRAHSRMIEGHEAYRRGDFEGAARDYAAARGADAHYNRGNALAKAGDYPGAIAAYDRALKMRPDMPDAVANRAAVAAVMKRKPPPGGGRQPPTRSKGADSSKGTSGPSQPSPGAGTPAGTPPTQNPQQRPPPAQRSPTPPANAKPRDAAAREAQQAADAAQRARMREADQRKAAPAAQPAGASPGQSRETAAQRERRIANEALLRRVPDDPGALLRAKLRLEYERRQLEGRSP